MKKSVLFFAIFATLVFGLQSCGTANHAKAKSKGGCNCGF